MAEVSINAASVAAAGGALIDAGGAMSKGASSAMVALGNSGGLPPAFRGRAANLAARCPSGKLASDCFATNGMELRTRAQVAQQYDAGGSLRKGGLPSLPSAKSLATSPALRLWNPQTAKAAAKNPGGMYRDINKMLNPLPKAGKSTAGKFKCTATVDVKLYAMPEGKSKTKGDLASIANAMKNGDKVTIKQLLALDPKELKIVLKGGAMIQGKAGCYLDLGKGSKASLYASLTIDVGASAGKKGEMPKLGVKGKVEAAVGSKALTAFVNVEIKKEIKLTTNMKEQVKALTKPTVKDLKDLVKAGKPSPGLRSEDWTGLAKKIFSSPPPPPVYTPTMPIGPDFVHRPTLLITPGKG